MRSFAPALLAALALAAAATPAAASTTMETNLQDDPQLLGKPIEQVADTMDRIKALGVDRIRVTVNWWELAPAQNSQTKPLGFDGANPAAYPGANWRRYDAIVRLARAKGLAVHFNPTTPAPHWATQGTPARPDLEDTWNPSPAEYGAMVRALGIRYSGSYDPCATVGGYCDPFPLPDRVPNSGPLPRVGFWSLLNEPNHAGWLTPQSDGSGMAAARMYRTLLDAGYRALVATGHGPSRDTVLIGELAPQGQNAPDPTNNVKPLPFLRALYCVSASNKRLRGAAATQLGCPDGGAAADFVRANPGLFDASGVAHHPYSLIRPPASRSSDRDVVVLADLGRLTLALDRFQRVYGRNRRLPVWLTEYGYQTRPPDPFGVRFAQQAEYLNEAEWMVYRNPRIRSFSQFLLVDDAPRQGVEPGDPRYWSTFQSGLVTLEGRRKPAHAAFRLPIHVPDHSDRGGRFTVWGALRPAPNGSRQSALIQFRRGSSGAFRTVRTVTTRNPRGYLQSTVRVPGSGQLRLVWRGSASRLVSVRR